jgi:hypothetical protein
MASSRSSTDQTQQTANTHSLPSHRPRVAQSEIEGQPWRYIGYRYYSKLIASTNEFFIFRRFATLNARAILHLQHEIVALESKLIEFDDKNEDATPPMHNGSFKSDEGSERAELLSEIQKKIYKYSMNPIAK